MERLQKYMAACGVASRRKCEELIESGQVTVNGQTITELGFRVDPIMDLIHVNGQPLHKENKKYIMLHKPRGYVTTVTDPQNRKTVIDLLDNIEERLFPVGRLDYDTSGLLLLTNDGDLAYKLTHPSFELEKEYVAKVLGKPHENALNALRKGVMLEDGITAPAKVELLECDANFSKIKIIIHEGRNRQVRRMFDYIKHPVRRLMREKVGFLTLEGLDIGNYRDLTSEEVTRLFNELAKERE
ncbi:pseudouridine synthase [Desulfuribacillus stibiiarsenatis]|uniref:Pseudouridine synthase n=1 Tax=Desulfuribacillus stibiiarsenatis TaxID=1390249 RepID=A0A1E5L6D3_9FIRM|nr:pseudouridine synthase [Desulfuribacillus stibiiarsenatis]OEH85722.1 pseudouridine synthase [Desulfuribacillus stibiiarsenatis]